MILQHWREPPQLHLAFIPTTLGNLLSLQIHCGAIPTNPCSSHENMQLAFCALSLNYIMR